MKPDNQHHQKTKNEGRSVGDEYFTSYEEVAHIFEKIIDPKELEGKHVYLPCDDDNSAFTTYLRRNFDRLKLKRLTYTYDDFNLHEPVFAEADVIITNPPFTISKITKLMKLIKKHDKKFFIFGSLTAVHRYINECGDWMYRNKIMLRNYDYKFTTTTGKDYVVLFSIYITNMAADNTGIDKNTVKFKDKTADDITLKANYDDKEAIAVDYTRDFPYDYDGDVLVPISFLTINNTHLNEFDYKLVKDKTTFNDGKNRYVRLEVRRKQQYVGKKFNI